MVKLSEYIQKSRTSRLDEWQMDVAAHKAKKLEQRIQELEEAIESMGERYNECTYFATRKVCSNCNCGKRLDKTEDKE